MRNGPVLLDRYVPDEDATVVEWVLDAGATILGKAVRESLCFSGQPQPHRRLVYGRTAAAGEARDEVHDAAQDPTGPSLARSPSRRTRGAVFAAGRWSKRTRNAMQGSVLIPSHGRSSRFGHQADHLITPPTNLNAKMASVSAG
jgi:hypothetical protein